MLRSLVASIEVAIKAHGIHVHIAEPGSAKELDAEVEPGVEAGGVELSPEPRFFRFQALPLSGGSRSRTVCRLVPRHGLDGFAAL